MTQIQRKMFKICMITNHILPNAKPMADFLRFQNLKRTLEGKGNKVVVITRNNKLWIEKVIEESLGESITVYKVPSINVRWIRHILFMLFLFPVLIKVYKREKPDVIFANSIFCAPSLYLFRKIVKRVLVHFDIMGVVHQEALLKTQSKVYGILQYILYKFLNSISLKSADIITTINESHKRIIEKNTQKSIYVIRDAIDTRNFTGTIVDDLLKKDKNDVFMVFVGSLSRRRLDALFDIIPFAFEEAQNLKLVIIGDGADREYYARRASEFGLLNSTVFFLGYIPNEKVTQYINSADICYSDIWSTIGFPMKVFEYMAVGKAVVAEDTVAAREILTDGMNALLYKDEKDLLEKIVLLAKDRNLREDFGRNARELVMKEHTWKKRGEEIAHIYKAYTPKHNGRS